VEETAVHQLIAEVKAGKTESFAPLIEEYKDLVYSISLKICSNSAEAEEIAQDAFIKAFQGLNKFRGTAKFSTWLYQITYFTALNAVRKKKVEQNDFYNVLNFEADENCLSHLISEERKTLIEKALTYLKPDERGIITLYYLDELSTEEVAKITRNTISNVKVKTLRARKKLYGILEKILQNELNSIQYES
jgi:RNA polymerase sigma-70 factor (ECF subfamily)